MVTPGEKAPDFVAPALVDGEGTAVELFKEIRTHDATVLYFYPADFVPECTAELVAIEEAGWGDGEDLAVVGLSGESLFSHAAYAEQYDLSMPFVSDFHGNVADTYGLLLDEWEGHNHIPARAAVVIDDEWEVLAVERAEDPLEWAKPAPLKRAGDVLQSAGIDVQCPTVEYGKDS
jgi:peroxiredoxin